MLRGKTIRSVCYETTDDIDIVSDGYINFVQVKSTGKTRWNISDIVRNSKGADKETIPCSLILHKSMQCKSDLSPGRRYSVVTEEKVDKTLEYLTISSNVRLDKSGRQEPIDGLSRRTDNLLTDSSISVSDWIDAVTWEMFSSLRELELLGIRNMRLAPQNLYGAILSSETVTEDIWRCIFGTVTRKNEHSRRTHSADGKSCLRPDLLKWFKQRVENDQSRLGRKIYVKWDLPRILMSSGAPMAPVCTKCKGQALHQQYSLEKYRYKHIADNVCQWLGEVLLRPKEMSDTYKLTFIEKRERLKNPVFKSLHDVNEFLGQVSLYATIQRHHKSQLIPCMLYVGKTGAEKTLENTHTIRRDPEGDQLWIGFSESVTGINIVVRLSEVRDQPYEDISGCIDTARKKILDIEDDNYLLRRSTDETLDGGRSFDAHLDRSTFVLFVSYDSNLLAEPEAPGFKDDLEKEAAVPFEKLVANLTEDSPSTNLYIYVLIYPTPSSERLTQLVDEKAREIV